MQSARVDVSDKALIFETLKRRQKGLYRSVPIPESLLRNLKKLLTGKDKNEPIWTFSRTSGWRLIREVMEDAGISGIHACPKGLRHGFAVACVFEDIPLTTIQKWMGHALLETTAIYLNIMGREERDFAKRLWKDDR